MKESFVKRFFLGTPARGYCQKPELESHKSYQAKNPYSDAAGSRGQVVPAPHLFRCARFHVPTEFLPHRREHFFCKRVFLPRTEANVQCRREHVGGNCFFERGLNRPAPLAGILYIAYIYRKRGIVRESHSGLAEQTRIDDHDAPLHL